MIKQTITGVASCVAVLFGSAGCTARAYEGPDRPRDEIATITFSTPDKPRIDELQIDGNVVSTMADVIEVLPGAHEFKLFYTFESPEPCSPSDIFCTVAVETGVCDGSVLTLAGRAYLVTLKQNYSLVVGTVLAKSYFDFSVRADEPNVGGISCQPANNYDRFR